MRLADPWLLLLLVPVLWLGLRSLRREAVPRLIFPAWRQARSILPSARRRLAPVSRLLRLIGAACLVVAAARPQVSTEAAPSSREGIDILLVLDVSSSMARQDLLPGTSRLDVARDVLRRFVAGREHDRIGLLAFARFPRLLCPPTLDHRTLLAILEEVEPVDPQSEENTTALGVAIAAAAVQLEAVPGPSRVMVLLTDGENRVPDVDPRRAAELALSAGVRVHAVAASREAGAWARELRELAGRTGGEGYVARDAAALQGIYEDIDRLETRPLEEGRRMVHADAWLPWLIAALLLLLAERPVEVLLLRRTP